MNVTQSTVHIHVADVADLREILLKWLKFGSHKSPPTPNAYSRVGEVDSPSCLVAAVDNQIVGFVTYRRMGRRIVMGDIAVLPKFRRHGIAHSLLSGILEMWTDRCRTIQVDVHESYLPAHELLKKVGFRAVRILKSKGRTYYRMTWHADRVPTVFLNRISTYFE